LASSTGSSRLFGPSNAASLAVQAETESIWALSLTRLAPLAVSLCPWSLAPPPPQVALSSPGQRKVDASGPSRSACRRITTRRTSHPDEGLQPPLRTGPTPGHLDSREQAASSQERPEPVCARRSFSTHSLSHCYYYHPQLSRIDANHTSTVTASTRPRAISIWSPSQMTLWPLWSRRPRPAHPSHPNPRTLAYRKTPQTASQRNRRIV
jgi:hypothetical protein